MNKTKAQLKAELRKQRELLDEQQMLNLEYREILQEQYHIKKEMEGKVRGARGDLANEQATVRALKKHLNQANKELYELREKIKEKGEGEK